MNIKNQLEELAKALELGSYDAAPSALAQGSALQVEDLSSVMEMVTFESKHLQFQNELSVREAKGQLYQFVRQLSHGIMGGSAQLEGAIGEEDTSDWVRAVVPMAYYSTVRRVTIAANLAQTFDGKKAEDREAASAALKLAGDIERDLFLGHADFSNAGVFDGNPLAVAQDLPGIRGVDAQVRESDALASTQDLMLAEFGSDQTVVIAVNGTLKQADIADAATRSMMNLGQADALYLDPITLNEYNKIAFAKERIVLAGAPAEKTGASFRSQVTTSGDVMLKASRFLSGKTRPAAPRSTAPAAPTLAGAAAADPASVLPAGTYTYKVTAVSDRGEGLASTAVAVTIAAGDKAVLTIGAVAGAKYYNVYRSEDGGTAATAKFIGRVKAAPAGATFDDLGHRSPGSVTGFLIQHDTMEIAQLAPYSRLRLSVSDLSLPEAHYRFLTLAVKQPRKNILLENIDGQLK